MGEREKGEGRTREMDLLNQPTNQLTNQSNEFNSTNQIKSNQPIKSNQLNPTNQSNATKKSYSGFIVLYPLGVASELTMAWLALPALKKTGKWSIVMPNAYNFAFSYYWACIITMLVYIPGELHIIIVLVD